MRDVIFTVWRDACDRVGQCIGSISMGFSLGDLEIGRSQHGKSWRTGSIGPQVSVSTCVRRNNALAA